MARIGTAPSWAVPGRSETETVAADGVGEEAAPCEALIRLLATFSSRSGTRYGASSVSRTVNGRRQSGSVIPSIVSCHT